MKQELIVKGRTFGKGKPLVCLPVMKHSAEDIVAEVKRLVDMSADVIEWRVDAFEEVGSLNSIRELLAQLKNIITDTPFIYTFRSKEQGGLISLTPEEVYDLHQVAAESGVVDFVDVEFFQTKNPNKEIQILQGMGVKVITSHHDFDETPEEEVMDIILENMRESRTDVVKLAVMPKTPKDVAALLSSTSKFHEKYKDIPLVTMSMGKLGMVSRISGETFGSCLTFGNPGEASAPGQIEAPKLAEILDVLRIE